MDYLYALQQLSEGPLKVLSPFFAIISEFGLQGLPVVAAIIYWCADSKKGYRLLLFMSWSSFTANIFKAIIQVPRPWLTDSRIYLDPIVTETATGHSMPSVHASMATAGYCGIAYEFKKKWLSVLCVLLLVLTAFARNFLRAHTLEDVLVGIVQALVVVVILEGIFRFIDKNEKYAVLIAVAGIIICLAAGLVILSTYSVGTGDVEADKMAGDVAGTMGLALAVMLGWILEKKVIKLQYPKKISTRIVRGVLGTAIFGLYFKIIVKKIVVGWNVAFAGFFKYFSAIVIALILVPFLFRLTDRITEKKEA